MVLYWQQSNSVATQCCYQRHWVMWKCCCTAWSFGNSGEAKHCTWSCRVHALAAAWFCCPFKVNELSILGQVVGILPDRSLLSTDYVTSAASCPECTQPLWLVLRPWSGWWAPCQRGATCGGSQSSLLFRSSMSWPHEHVVSLSISHRVKNTPLTPGSQKRKIKGWFNGYFWKYCAASSSEDTVWVDIFWSTIAALSISSPPPDL